MAKGDDAKFGEKLLVLQTFVVQFSNRANLISLRFRKVAPTLSFYHRGSKWTVLLFYGQWLPKHWAILKIDIFGQTRCGYET